MSLIVHVLYLKAPSPAIISVVATEGYDSESCSDKRRTQTAAPVNLKGLKTTINCPDALNNDRLKYMYVSHESSLDEHIPGKCSCNECIVQHGMVRWFRFISSYYV